jgi:hypothetical protein
MKIREGAYYRTRGGDVVGPIRNDKTASIYPLATIGQCWTISGRFSANSDGPLDLIAEVYVSDTPPTLITVRTGSSGGGGGMTPDMPRVGFDPPDQRQTADAPAPETKTLRDELVEKAALAILKGYYNDATLRLTKNGFAEIWREAEQFVEARRK